MQSCFFEMINFIKKVNPSIVSFHFSIMRIIFCLLFLSGCFSALAQSKKLTGTWDNQNGQLLVFQKNRNALWIFYSENKRDTFVIKFSADLKKNPGQLDLSGFKEGPLSGKTLFGIVEFKGKNIIRFDCEPGVTEAVRPKEFNPGQTQTYYKKQGRG